MGKQVHSTNAGFYPQKQLGVHGSTGGSVKNGASYDHQIFTVACLKDSSFRNRKAFP